MIQIFRWLNGNLLHHSRIVFPLSLWRVWRWGKNCISNRQIECVCCKYMFWLDFESICLLLANLHLQNTNLYVVLFVASAIYEHRRIVHQYKRNDKHEQRGAHHYMHIRSIYNIIYIHKCIQNTCIQGHWCLRRCQTNRRERIRRRTRRRRSRRRRKEHQYMMLFLYLQFLQTNKLMDTMKLMSNCRFGE